MVGPSTPRILIVEDDVAVGEMLQVILQHQGFRAPVVVRSGDAATCALARERFDVIIVDLELPDMNGADLLADVRRHTPDIRRIICSAHECGSEPVERARELAHGVVAKRDIAQVGTLVHALVRSLPRRGS